MTVFLFISIEHGLRCNYLACREALKKWHEPERSTKREVISPPIRQKFLNGTLGSMGVVSGALPDAKGMKNRVARVRYAPFVIVRKFLFREFVDAYHSYLYSTRLL